MKYLLIIFFVTLNSAIATPRLVRQDAFLFKVLTNVVSLNELKEDFLLLEDFKCFYPESFLLVIFDDLFAKTSEVKELNFKNLDFNKEQRELFKKFIKFYKLQAYVDSHTVVVSNELITGLYTMGKKLNCRLAGFESSKKLNDRFTYILKMEIFVRSRFSDVQTLKDQKKKQSAMLFLESVSKQITEEVFW